MTGTHVPTGRQAQVEALWAKDVGSKEIVRRTGFPLLYVQHCVRLIQAHARTIRPESQDSDDGKHLNLILTKHRAGFPYFPSVPI